MTGLGSGRILAIGGLLLVAAAFLPFVLPLLADGNVLSAGEEDGGGATLVVAAPVDRIERGPLSEPPVLPLVAPSALEAILRAPLLPRSLAEESPAPPPEAPLPSRTSRRL